MSTKRWKTSKTAVFNLGYHMIWCPKYRRKVLVGPVETRLKALLLEKAHDLNCTIESMAVMPDHVHLIVKTLPVHAPHYVVGQLKRYTSAILRHEFPQLKSRLPSLWTRSYYMASVGHISEATIKQYIADQKNK